MAFPVRKLQPQWIDLVTEVVPGLLAQAPKAANQELTWLSHLGRFSRLSSPVTLMLDAAGDSSPRAPLIFTEADSEAFIRFRRAIGVDRAAKGAEQLFAELGEMERLMRRAAQLQLEIQRLKLFSGTEGQILSLTDELEGLQIQMQTAAKTHPIMGGALAMVASANRAAPAATTEATPDPVADRLDRAFRDSLTQSLDQSWHVNDADKAAMRLLLQRDDPITELGWRLWQALEADYLRWLRAKGAAVKQANGFIVITIRGHLPTYALGSILSGIRSITPTLGVRVVDSLRAGRQFIFPTVESVRHVVASVLGMATADWQWVTGEIDRGDIMHLHHRDRVPIGLPLKTLSLEDLRTMVHPFEFALHDLFHGLLFRAGPPEVRRYAGEIYEAAVAADRMVPGSDMAHQLINALVEFDADSRLFGESRPMRGWADRFMDLRDMCAEDRPFLREFHAQLRGQQWHPSSSIRARALLADVAEMGRAPWERDFWEDVRTDVPTSPIATSDEKAKLKAQFAAVDSGVASSAELADTIEAILCRDFIDVLRQTQGVTKVVDEEPAGYISVYYQNRSGHMPTRMDPNLQSLHRLLEAYNLLLDGVDPTMAEYDFELLRIPKPRHLWKMIQARFPKQIPELEFVARDIDREHLVRAHAEDRALVALRIDKSSLLFGDVNLMVHPWIFASHDWYRAISFAVARPEVREMAAQLYLALQEAVRGIPNTLRKESGLDKAMGQLLDLETKSNDGLADLLTNTLWFLRKGWLRVPKDDDKRAIQRHRLSMDVFHRLEAMVVETVFTGEHAEAQRAAVEDFLGSLRVRYGIQ